eukprot:TRINITY_DN40951_c0_g1_i1.p1 TRINITY_DN40951_c0_g1~~TRINITY_DN40951_c0_g1_i1.p1  ORF type:complete len:455 (-),score=47.96 TRINITY_DN40951_c0_g1_i1:72-1334(-)
MAGALPLVGARDGDTPGGVAVAGQPLEIAASHLYSLAGQELAPVCATGMHALKRVTALLSSARKADAQGEYQQARELYSEVLKVQRSIGRAPVNGHLGKSLKEVAVGVEARLQCLQGGDGLGAGSRGTAGGPPSASRSGGFSGNAGCRGSSFDDLPPPRSSRMPGGAPPLPDFAACWDTEGIPEYYLASPRDLRDDCRRPTTRDGGARPLTQDGSRRPSAAAGDHRAVGSANGCEPMISATQWWPGGQDGMRPSTRDAARETRTPGTATDGSRMHQAPLDGVRPSTRDGARLQQMIDGSGDGHHQASAVAPQRGAADRGGIIPGPPPQQTLLLGATSRNGLSSEKAQKSQSSSHRQVSGGAGRRKRHHHHHVVEEVMGHSPEVSSSPPPPMVVCDTPEVLSLGEAEEPELEEEQSADLLE